MKIKKGKKTAVFFPLEGYIYMLNYGSVIQTIRYVIWDVQWSQMHHSEILW